MSSGTDAIPRSSSLYDDDKGIGHIALIFSGCAIMLVVLLIFRTAINIIVIDVCILGDFGSCKTLFCCHRLRRYFGTGSGDNDDNDDVNVDVDVNDGNRNENRDNNGYATNANDGYTDENGR